MNFITTLLEQYNLMESLDSIIKSNPNIPEQTIRAYHQHALPDGNKSDRVLNHVLKMHRNSEITPDRAAELKPHLTALHLANQLNKISSLKTLGDHKNATIGMNTSTKKERVDVNTPVVYEDNNIVVKQHLNHESAIKSAILHPTNPMYNETTETGKAQWCTSSDSKLGNTRFNTYTNNGTTPLYTIHNKVTKRIHALVADESKEPNKVELRDEKDSLPPTVNGNKSIAGVLYRYPGIEKSPAGTFLKQKYPDDFNSVNKIPPSATSDDLQHFIDNGSDSEKLAAYQHPNLSYKQMQQGLDGKMDHIKMVLSNEAVPNDLVDNVVENSPFYEPISAALQHPNVSYNSVQTGIGHHNLQVRMTALQQYRHVTPENIDHAQTDKSAVIRAVAATHPNLSPTQLTRAIEDKDEMVQTLALYNKNVTEGNINHLLLSNDKDLIHRALSHPNATNNNFINAIKHEDPYVRDAVVSHPNLKKHHLEMLARDVLPSIRNKANNKLLLNEIQQ